MAKRKKKLSKKTKVGIAAFLFTAITYNYLKNLFMGTKAKKIVFYTAVGSLFIYNSCGDEIGEFFRKKDPEPITIIENKKQEQFLTQKFVEKKTIPSYIKQDTLKSESYSKSKDSTNYWYVVKKGDNLSDIAKKYYGELSLYKKLANHNRIKNASYIEVGFPLLMNKENLQTTDNLRTDKRPNNLVVIKKGETVKEKLYCLIKNNANINEIVDDVISYNHKKGNNIPAEGYKTIREAIIYLPENMK